MRFFDLQPYLTQNNEKIPAYFIKPKDKKKYPTIIYCHAHGGNYSLGRDELIHGRKSLISEYASLLCSIGYAVMCLEMPCFGDRQIPSESSLAKSLNWYGKTLYGKMMSELISGIDFLTKRKDVNKSKIISLGFSMGATHSYWLAALDRRISKCIHICSFADLASLIKNGNLNELVAERASNAFIAGADGIICSPLEAKLIRSKDQFSNKIIVTPGIRLNYSENDESVEF